MPLPSFKSTEKQPTSSKRAVPPRKFDTTALHEKAHGEYVHRDYAAHFFRWGFAGRFVNASVSVLDVGCGVDVPFMKVLTHPRSNVPKSYVGVDYNSRPRKLPSRQWATLYFDFDFTSRYDELGQFDLVTNFEVIEHMAKPDGEKLLSGMANCLNDDGRLLLSTPVFNGKAAANHVHEWTIDELTESIDGADLEVVDRFGTFASYNAITKVCSPQEKILIERLKSFYSGEVLSCFLAPKYPDASRNNVWVLKKK